MSEGRISFVILAVCCIVAVLTSVPAAGQQGGTISLVAQTPYVPAEGDFEVMFAWSGPVSEGMTLGGTIYAPISSETEVQEAPANPFAAITAVPLALITRGPDGVFVFSLPIRSVPDGDPTRTLIRQAGVLPVTLEIRAGDGTTLASLRTNLIRLPGEVAEEGAGIPVAMVLEVSSAEGLTIDRTSELLVKHPQLPVAVQLGDGVIAQLENDFTAAATFRAALGPRPVIASPELNLDPSALSGIDRGDLYSTAREETLARLDSLELGSAGDTLPLDTNLTTEGIDLLRSLGTTIVIDTGPLLRPTGLMSGSTGTVSVIQIDDDLTAGLRGSARAVERAHRLLATLAIRSETDLSPIVLGGSALRGVPLAAIDTVLTALDAPGLLSIADLTVVADQATLPIRADEQPSQNLESAAEPIATFTETMTTYESFFVSGRRPPAVFEARLLEALSPVLNPDDRLRAIAQLQDDLEAELSGVDLPDGQSVTLAAQRAEIPITVNNDTDGVRRVLLSFDSDKIRVDQDGETIELPPGVSTIDIDLEALSLGQSPLWVSIQTPDETTELAVTQFGVRSTAIPGLGLLLSAAALVFLLAWWMVTWTRDRARRHHPSARGRTDATDTVTA